MKIAYGDLIGGVSGDMFVAALLDLGVPLGLLEAELKKIPKLNFTLRSSRKTVDSIRARRFEVVAPEREPARPWKNIRELIQRSRLAPEIKETGLRIFTRLAEAEGKIHGVASDRVHFHEIGATDSIVDIMAAAIGARHLGIERFHFSRIPLGRGIARTAHGPLPIPGPATLELLKNQAVVWTDLEGESVTPTGAAIVSALGSGSTKAPAMEIHKIGYGAGSRDWPDRPNLFRIVLGDEIRDSADEQMLVIETNIDDMNPQFYDHVMERLFAAGARDVFLTPIQMKKNRPGVLLTVLCEPPHRGRVEGILFKETSTIGVRSYPVGRTILKREPRKVKTRFGEVNLKIVEQPDGSKRATPEYDDLKRIAAAQKIPIKQLHDEVMRIAGR